MFSIIHVGFNILFPQFKLKCSVFIVALRKVRGLRYDQNLYLYMMCLNH